LENGFAAPETAAAKRGNFHARRISKVVFAHKTNLHYSTMLKETKLTGVLIIGQLTDLNLLNFGLIVIYFSRGKAGFIFNLLCEVI
jgi:hypothetical protein